MSAPLSTEDVAGLEPAPKEDLLRAARTQLAELREAEAQAGDLEERAASLRRTALEIRSKRLVDLLSEAGIKSLTIDAEGNLPALVATLRPFYAANIAASWPAERRDAAFDALERVDAGDIIKHTFTIALGTRDVKTTDGVRAALKKLRVEFAEQRAVPHGTLTAWLRESVERGHEIPDLETIGAAVGQIVDVKQPKEKKQW